MKISVQPLQLLLDKRGRQVKPGQKTHHKQWATVQQSLSRQLVVLDPVSNPLVVECLRGFIHDELQAHLLAPVASNDLDKAGLARFSTPSPNEQ